jgi:hypothetical protein
MSTNNEQIIRRAYQLAEAKDVDGFVAAFTEDGTFTDESIEVVYRGPDELGKTVEIYATAFPDMHRQRYRQQPPRHRPRVRSGTHLLHLRSATFQGARYWRRSGASDAGVAGGPDQLT